MKDYIERAAVHDLVKRIPKYEMFNYDRTESLIGISPDDVDFGVDKIPAADVAPVVHGRWEYDENATDWGIGGYICSECKTKNNNLPCNRVKSVRMFSGAKFCPNCGAKMEE